MKEDLQHMANALKTGDRMALAQAITLLESSRISDRALKTSLLNELHDGTEHSVRIAITGAPGVGKSSLIEVLGLELIRRGHKVAVLAIDPSSTRTGGSILGDKTRMTQLSRNEHAFIRPSPTSGVLGGVSHATRETIIACEAAGYDRILIETVGVGQSETTVASLADMVLFITMTGSGDALQGIKRGILEWVDLVAVNKSEGSNSQPSLSFATELESALHLLHADSHPPRVVLTSAVSSLGITEVLDQLAEIANERKQSGDWSKRRLSQRSLWFEEAFSSAIVQQLFQNTTLANLKSRFQADVESGKTHPYIAAQALVDQLPIGANLD